MNVDKVEQAENYHTPVLLEESLEGLSIRPGGTYVDATFGGGGHSRALLSRLNADGRLFGFDQDADVAPNILSDNRFVFVRGNFRYLSNFMQYHGVESVDGILADLGVSSHHFDEGERGFSFRFDARLDMRMNQSASFDASTLLNEYEENELARVFRTYGELKNALHIARAIIASRPIESVKKLLDVIRPFVNKEKEKKVLAQLFQSLRIEVNDELEALKEMLLQAVDVLKPGGRLVVITYHSLEDRLVKNFFRSGNFDGIIEKDFYGNVKSPFIIVNTKVITPSEIERNTNPRSRSAKLRIAEKK